MRKSKRWRVLFMQARVDDASLDSRLLSYHRETGEASSIKVFLTGNPGRVGGDPEAIQAWLWNVAIRKGFTLILCQYFYVQSRI
jgi:hypothetical protein